MGRRAIPDDPASAVVLAVLCAAVGVIVLWPAGFVLWDVGQGLARLWREGAGGRGRPIGAEAASFARSLGVALSIGILGTLLAWAPAWFLRARSQAWAAVLVVPMLLPSYSAYSSWGQLRAPGTPLAAWIADRPPVVSLWVGYSMAIGGLALWVWPVCALILLAGLRRLDPGALESLRLEPVRVWRRVWVVLGMTRWSWAVSIAVVTVLMLGSAVPLHLALLETYSIRIWIDLMLAPPGEFWRVWLGAWPLLLLAVAGGLLLGRAVLRASMESGGEVAGPGARAGPRIGWAGPAAGALWGVSVFVPLILFYLGLGGGEYMGPGGGEAGGSGGVGSGGQAWSEGKAGYLGTFLQLHGRSMAVSLGIAAWVGGVGAVLVVGTWWGLSAGPRIGAVAGWCGRILLIAGLIPGVLVGNAVAMAWGWGGIARGVEETTAIVILAHLARYGFVGALAGAWLAWLEGPTLRDLRRVDGAMGVRGWLGASLPLHAGALGGAAVGMAVLSFHEIEAAMMVMPPGLFSFPHVMLEFLHFWRSRDMSAGAIYVLGGGFVASLVAVGLLLVTIRLAGRAGRNG